MPEIRRVDDMDFVALTYPQVKISGNLPVIEKGARPHSKAPVANRSYAKKDKNRNPKLR